MSEPLFKVRGLKKHFISRKGFFGRQVQTVRAVDGVDLDIFPRETVGMVGESGCGKTTAGRSMIRLIEPTAGVLEFEGQDLMKLKQRDLRRWRRKFQIIFQDPYSSLNPRMTVGNIIGEALEIHGIATGDKRTTMVKDLLARVGLQPSYLTRYPHEFSGGQRQRIGIARALAVRPRFIVCDEAVSALDVSVQAQILNLLRELQTEFDISYLFIAHDLSVVRHISHRIAVMYLGQPVEVATRQSLYSAALHPYSQALLSAVPQVDPKKRRRRVILQGDVPSPLNPPSGCRFHTRCPLVMDRCKTEAPALHEARERHFVRCHLYDGLAMPAPQVSIYDGSKIPAAGAAGTREEPVQLGSLAQRTADRTMDTMVSGDELAPVGQSQDDSEDGVMTEMGEASPATASTDQLKTEGDS